jgi:hypothetical protein
MGKTLLLLTIFLVKEQTELQIISLQEDTKEHQAHKSKQEKVNAVKK